MKKYIFSTLTVLSATVLMTSCNDALDTEPRVTEMTAATFPGKPADVEALNAGVYSILSTMGGGDNSQTINNPFYWWSLMSDDNYGSGGLQDFMAKCFHHLTMADANQYEYDWNLFYGGVSRANTMIETIDNVAWTDAQTAQRNQLLGEAFFMRGYFTLLLTQMFGDVPLITTTVITSDSYQERSAEEFIYPQIIADFTSAKNLMKSERLNKSGHADKYCAEAYLARAYMFWAGFYKSTKDLSTGGPSIELVDINGEPIVQEGLSVSSISKEDVVNGLKDIVSNGGYRLLKDYRSLWGYSNSFLLKEALDGEGHAYEFIADMDPADCFDKEGNGNGNDEELFQIQFMNASNWNNLGGYYSNARMFSNYLMVFWGLRNGATNKNGELDRTYPFNMGWGQGTPSCNIWDDWTTAEREGGYTDKRKKASLIDFDHELANYTYESDDCEESGYGVKKYAAVNLDANGGKDWTWWSQAPGYSSSSLGDKMQGDHFEDFYLMRYADVLLMLSELTGDAQYMNQVQARAGVPQTAYSLKAIQDERRWEFAFEGLRFNDLRRWTGKGCSNGTYAPDALQAQSGKQIVCYGQKDHRVPMAHMTCSWEERYKATDGFLPKPQNQISLHSGGLTQNPGWDTADPKTQYKSLY